MNEQKKHNITLYITLAIAVIALIIGVVGLIRSGKSDSQALRTPGSSTPSSSQLAPPPGTDIQSLPSGSNLNSSGTVNH